MLKPLIENMSWIFSGIGVFLLGLAVRFVYRFHCMKRPVTSSGVERKAAVQQFQNEVFEEKQRLEKTEVEKISGRFRAVLDLMNEDRHYSKFTIAQLAGIMRLDKVSELENFFTGIEEPTLNFVNRFCEAFGVNKSWLLEDKEHPFSDDKHPKAEPLDYFEDIQDIEPEYIYFIRENTETAPAFIVLKLSEWNYKILRRTWHISDHVGAGGQASLLSFYKLVNKLRDKGYYLQCGGLTLEKNDFRALLFGDKFPGNTFKLVELKILGGMI